MSREELPWSRRSLKAGRDSDSILIAPSRSRCFFYRKGRTPVKLLLSCAIPNTNMFTHMYKIHTQTTQCNL